MGPAGESKVQILREEKAEPTHRPSPASVSSRPAQPPLVAKEQYIRTPCMSVIHAFIQGLLSGCYVLGGRAHRSEKQRLGFCLHGARAKEG